jgi:hypothetical protein
VGSRAVLDAVKISRQRHYQNLHQVRLVFYGTGIMAAISTRKLPLPVANMRVERTYRNNPLNSRTQKADKSFTFVISKVLKTLYIERE